ncbi:hypothetical protein DFJ73DRAFT_967286 [Zopfochytrium polystomum]|nr:hypothetical protein DFJ73DRAFT_967286 [Zopfochytrium polystomum]
MNTAGDQVDTILKLDNLQGANFLDLGQGFNILDGKAVQLNILPTVSGNDAFIAETMERRSSVCFSVEESMKSKLNKIGIAGSAAVGFIFNIFSISGGFSFLKQKSSDEKSVSATLVIRSQSKQKCFIVDRSLEHLDRHLLLKTPTAATHIVTKVAFGAYATCTFTYQLEKKEDVLEIQGKLQAALNVLIASLDLTGQGEYANKDLSFFEKTTLSLEGTFLSQQSVPSNPNEMIRFFRSIPNLFNYENHVAYELTPVDSIRKRFQPNHPVARYLLLKDEFANTLFASVEGVQNSLSEARTSLKVLIEKYGGVISASARQCLEEQSSAATMEETSLLASIRSFVTQKDADEKWITKKIDRLALEVKNAALGLKSACDERTKFCAYMIELYGRDKLTVENDLDQLGLHFKDHSEGAAFVYTEDLTAISDANSEASMQNRSIMLSLIKKYGRDENYKFYVRLREDEPFSFTQVDASTELEERSGFVHDVIRLSQLNEKINIQRNYEQSDECQSLVCPQIRIPHQSDVQKHRLKLQAGVPTQLKSLHLACPGPNCDNEVLEWRCNDCAKIFNFDNRGYIYCSCAGGSKILVQHAQFRCLRDKHQNDWVPCKDGVSLDRIHVLIIGSSGIGKSTIINGIANYLLFEDPDDAISRSSEAIVAIPGRFSASGYGRLVDGKMEEEPTSVITFGDQSSSIENINSEGAAVTQFCQMYTIHLHNRDIVFIDCPGIVDGRGIEKDQENLQHIMSFISPLGYLNAIFFIMKPNEERLSSTFAYTVIESCSRLSKECKENIFILFTTSSTTNFRLGGTRDTLAKLQSKVSPDGRLDLLDDERHFFFDNSALRLVYAKTNGRELYPDPNGSLFESNRTAWAYSKAASVRLTTALLNLPTVRTDGLDTLTDTKALVQNVANFLVHVTSAIENTVRSLQRQQDEIRRMEKEKIALDKQLKVKYTFVKHVQLDLPMTVCSNAGCFEIKAGKNDDLSDIQRRKYIPCHKPCYLSHLPLNQVNPPGMINCNAFLNAANGKCHSCKARGKDCDYTLHMHMTSDVEFQDKEMILPEIQQQQDEKVNSINAYKSRIAALAAKEKQLEHEKELIIRQIARLAQFVLDNSLVPPSDEVLRYFRMEIQTLESYPDRDSAQEKNLKSLKMILARYEEELRILREAIRMRPAQSGDESGTSTVKSADEVKTIIANLCNMKEFGRNIKECIEALEKQRQAAATLPPGGSDEARFFDLNTVRRKQIRPKAQFNLLSTNTQSVVGYVKPVETERHQAATGPHRRVVKARNSFDFGEGRP